MDEEGLELPGPDAARDKAFAMGREMACAEVLDGHLHLGHRIEVADEGGAVVHTVRFSDTVEVAG